MFCSWDRSHLKLLREKIGWRLELTASLSTTTKYITHILAKGPLRSTIFFVQTLALASGGVGYSLSFVVVGWKFLLRV